MFKIISLASSQLLLIKEVQFASYLHGTLLND